MTVDAEISWVAWVKRIILYNSLTLIVGLYSQIIIDIHVNFSNIVDWIGRSVHIAAAKSTSKWLVASLFLS